LIKTKTNTSTVKISVSYPPLYSPKGRPFLGQNRQFQWTNTGNVILPLIPASGATALDKLGFKVYWDDAIAEKITYQKWLQRLLKRKPNIIFIESKTPVIKRHWQIIKDIKENLKDSIVVLMGDHVTALPLESFQHCPVDYVITGGDYDFMMISLVNHLTKKSPLEPGFYYRKNKKILNTGIFSLIHHRLDNLPMIDRRLTRWQLYGHHNANFKYLPGAYIMSARDCWWGRCTFCVTGDTEILTKEGTKTIETIVENKIPDHVLTTASKYQKITDWHKRKIKEKIKIISTLYLPYDLKITSNHQVYYLPKVLLKSPSPIRTGKVNDLKIGDFLAIPIDRKVKNITQIRIEDIIAKQPTSFSTIKKISTKKIDEITRLCCLKKSEREISKLLKVDRETVHRYKILIKSGKLAGSVNHLSYNQLHEISFFGGHHKIPSSITIDNDFLFIAGLYLAEGHISYHKNRPNSATIGFTYNQNETELISKTKQYFFNTFKIILSETINIKNHTCQLTVGSTIICIIFKSLFGKNCYQKKIPGEFAYLTTEKQQHLLKGLFAGDGHLRLKRKTKGGGIEYILETTSKNLADQVFVMLLRFDVLPSYKVIQSKVKKVATKYKITLFRQDILKVFPNIESLDNTIKTNKKGLIVDNYALVPIVNINEEQFNGYVYNLTVEKDHSYTANYLSVKNCSWTTTHPAGTFRTYSVNRVINEIKSLANLGIKEIFDDSGTFPIGLWLKDFCQQMISTGLNKKVVLGCNMRFAALDQSQYNLMAKSGFRFLLYGLESANQDTLSIIHKNTKVSDARKSLLMAKKAGLQPHLTIMIGYPWETEKMAQKTLLSAKILIRDGLADSLQATIIIPYPGTPLFNECQKKGWLLTTDWDKYDMRQSVMKSPLSSQTQLLMVKNIFKGILTPQFLFRKITSIKNLNDLKFLLTYAIKYVQKLKDFPTT